ncbi:hypothetical protein ACP70R_029662 [Stipagrostis hirtigluma subsp. patula]
MALNGIYWPRPSSGILSTDGTTPALMRHGLDPGTVDPLMDMVLGFLYGSLPRPPVSAAASLSCAASAAEGDGDGEGVDRISGLPDDLLRRVVSRLPAKDGARTTALSSRWRHIWRSAPLVLVDAHFLRGGGAEGRPPRRGDVSAAVGHAVSAALRSHPGPFPFVSLTCGFVDGTDADRAVLARWFQHLATKGVDELVFVNRPCPLLGLRLPAALFSCASLRRLFLGAWVFPDTASLPRGASFPNLKELILGSVVMEDRDLEFVLAASPVLETLTVVGNLQHLRPRLASHSLRSAQFCMCNVEEVTVVDAPHLERLFIWMSLNLRRLRTNRNQGTRIKIGCAPKLTMLGYLEPGVHVLEIGNTLIKISLISVACDGPIAARNKAKPNHHGSKCADVGTHLELWGQQSSEDVTELLEMLPQHRDIVYRSEVTREPTGNLNAKFWKKTGPIECIQLHLKVLVLREFQGEQSELDFLMFVAQNARVLQRLGLVLKLGRYTAPEEVGAKFMALDSTRWASGGSKLGTLMSRLRDGDCVWSLKAGTDFTFSDPFLCL